jgi:hypothetical protein
MTPHLCIFAEDIVYASFDLESYTVSVFLLVVQAPIPPAYIVVDRRRFGDRC